MAFDFPASPTLGQTFKPAGAPQTYVWAPPRWTVQGVPLGALAALDQVNTPQIVDSAVTNAKIASGAVDAPQIYPQAVTSAAIQDGAVTNAKLASGSVSNAKIQSAAISSDQLQANAVTTPAIANLNVTTAKLADGAITGPKLAAGVAVGNLGYTPVNKAGDSMSGALSTPTLGISYPVNWSGMRLDSDAVQNSTVWFRYDIGSYFNYQWGNNSLVYVCNNVLLATFNTNGDITLKGGVYTGPSGKLQLTADGTYQNVSFDAGNAYLQYNTANQNLYFVRGGTIRLTIDANGNATFANGVQVSGTFGCSGQGFFSGNLNAPINAGVGANAVVVGYFASGTWYNANSVGVQVGGTTGLLVYAGQSTNAFWSLSASDRRLKENIEPPSLDPLDVVRKLPIWACDYIAPKANPADLEDPEAWPEFREHWPFSFMADEVDAAMPNATIKDDDGRPVALHPQHLIATLWAAVQQLTDRLEGAEARLNAAGAA